MPFIKVKLDAKEPQVAPEAEYELRIVSVEEKKTGPTSKTPGEPMVLAMISIDEPGENYAPIFHNIMIPTSKTSEKAAYLYKLRTQRFLQVFNIPGDGEGFDTDDFPGATGHCLVVQEDGQDGPRNALELPRLDEEKAKPKERKPGRRGRRGSTDADDEIPF